MTEALRATPDPEEVRLIALARGGDEDAFDALVRAHRDRIWRLAVRLCPTPEAAEEVLQETFILASQALKNFRGESGLSTWLFRIATNAARVQRRKEARHAAVSLDDCLPQFDAQGTLARLDIDYSVAGRADLLAEQSELARAALEAVHALPGTLRDAFVLRDLEELSTEETARLLGLTPAAVRQRVHRARVVLRGALARLVEGEP